MKNTNLRILKDLFSNLVKKDLLIKNKQFKEVKKINLIID